MNDFDSVRFVDFAIASIVKALAEDAAIRLDIYKNMPDATPEHVYAIEMENRGCRQAVQYIYRELKGKIGLLTDLENLYDNTYTECIKVLTPKQN